MAAVQQIARLQAAFNDLPTELHSLVLAYAGAPLNTCKASRDVFKDPPLTVTWLLATNNNSIEDSLQKALDTKLWDACTLILDLKEPWDPVKLHFALSQAAGSGHLQLLEALLRKGGWAEWLWSADHPYQPSTVCWEGIDRLWEEHRPMYPGFNDFMQLCFSWHPLRSAAREGHLHTCTFLLQQKVICTAAKHQALVAAAGAGHLPVLQLLYESDEQVRKPERGDSALCAAAAGGHLGVVRFLLDQGASPCNSAGTLWSGKPGRNKLLSCLIQPGSPLSLAAAGGHTEILQLLHDRGLTFFLGHWHEALLNAIRAQRLCSISWLLTKAALQQQLHTLLTFHQTLQGGIDAEKYDPVYVAVKSGSTEVLEVLLHLGKGVSNKEAALAVAAGCGSVSHMELLLQHGADVDGETGSFTRWGPLGRAIQDRSLPALELLLEAGAEAGSSALALSVQCWLTHTCDEHPDPQQQVFEMLLAHGVTDDEGHALFQAAKRGLWQLVPTLLELGTSADAASQQQQSIGGNTSDLSSRVALALCVASQSGRLEMVQQLINYKGPGSSDINATAEGASEATSRGGCRAAEAEGSRPEPGARHSFHPDQGDAACSITSHLSQADLDRALLAATGGELPGYWTHLDWCSYAPTTTSRCQVMKLLIQHGADVDASEGAVLFAAVARSAADRSAVKLLLRAGANPQLRQASEAFSRALSNLNLWEAKLWLKHGAKPTEKELQLMNEWECFIQGGPEFAALGSHEDKSEEEDE
jgi:hypothetical protein